ncbi:16S rRNA (cytosine(1402)-N(4))-methyltransferase RsmH [soil metagenome]
MDYSHLSHHLPDSAAPEHIPVLLDEVLAAIRPQPGGNYVDGTFGGGGHTRALLEAAGPAGMVLAIDRDPAAVERGRRMALEPDLGGHLAVRSGSFADLMGMAAALSLIPLDGVLLDLGMSSFQLDAPDRGFSFSSDGPLDMRFDPSQDVSAETLVNDLSVTTLADIIWRFGEEPRSRLIARAIEAERQGAPIRSTLHLARIVERAVGGRRGARTHPATRTFQALRIEVNNELEELGTAIDRAIGVLRSGGRLAVISFHSLEDRLVKDRFRTAASSCICPPAQPVCTCDHRAQIRLIGKVIRPSGPEIERNPRSRSAILRTAERLEAETLKDVLR